ncbi:MAG TPA: type II toxin-antitoxin system VapC family toxin [Bryobacteraceae bacterium]|jgi:predicted nucleic-acid-binding protein|nr:type II toxin-antitoxin system VapC family toxin [Bryobacteraceae bacterium]
MRAVDTNVLVRLITRDDAGQAAVADAFIANGAWVSILALTETVWVLSSVYDRSPSQLATAIEMLLHHNELVLQNPETIAAALTTFRSKPQLGFSDCLMLQLARQAGHLPLGTFDRNLGNTAGAQRL